jgi:hypothetical protein
VGSHASTSGCSPPTSAAPEAFLTSHIRRPQDRLWHWPDIAHWLAEHHKAKVEVDAHAADLVAAMNAAFDLREHARHLHDKRDLALIAQALGEGILLHR